MAFAATARSRLEFVSCCEVETAERRPSAITARIERATRTSIRESPPHLRRARGYHATVVSLLRAEEPGKSSSTATAHDVAAPWKEWPIRPAWRDILSARDWQFVARTTTSHLVVTCARIARTEARRSS